MRRLSLRGAWAHVRCTSGSTKIPAFRSIPPILEDNDAMRRVFQKVLGSAQETSSVNGEVMLRYDFEDAVFDEPVVAS